MSDPTLLGDGEEDTLISNRPKELLPSNETFDEAKTMLSIKTKALDVRVPEPSVVISNIEGPPPSSTATPKAHSSSALSLESKKSSLTLVFIGVGLLIVVGAALMFLKG